MNSLKEISSLMDKKLKTFLDHGVKKFSQSRIKIASSAKVSLHKKLKKPLQTNVPQSKDLYMFPNILLKWKITRSLPP